MIPVAKEEYEFPVCLTVFHRKILFSTDRLIIIHKDIFLSNRKHFSLKINSSGFRIVCENLIMSGKDRLHRSVHFL
jgi:uncharacterized protein (DUF2225 family)